MLRKTLYVVALPPSCKYTEDKQNKSLPHPTVSMYVSVILHTFSRGITMNFDFASLSKAAERLKSGMESLREKAQQTLVTGESGGGLVKVTMNGAFIVQRIDIDESLLTDKLILQDLIVAAMNIAREKAEKSMQDQMSSLTGGLSIPGMPFHYSS